MVVTIKVPFRLLYNLYQQKDPATFSVTFVVIMFQSIHPTVFVRFTIIYEYGFLFYKNRWKTEGKYYINNILTGLACFQQCKPPRQFKSTRIYSVGMELGCTRLCKESPAENELLDIYANILFSLPT